MPGSIINVTNELCEGIRSVDLQNKDDAHQLPAAQHALIEFFEDYMGFCIDVCTYYNRSANGKSRNMSPSVL